MAAYCRVDDLPVQSPAGWLPVHRDQLRAQRSMSSMGSLYLFTFYRCHASTSICHTLPVRIMYLPVRTSHSYQSQVHVIQLLHTRYLSVHIIHLPVHMSLPLHVICTRHALPVHIRQIAGARHTLPVHSIHGIYYWQIGRHTLFKTAHLHKMI